LLLSAALLLLWLPASDSPKAIPGDSPSAAKAIAAATAQPAETPVRAELPDAPIAKADASIEPASSATPFSSAPIKSALERPVPTPRQQKLWYTFMAVSHGAAAFDAWSTRRAISGGYGTEGDPLLRPFAHSNAIYAATQVSPAVMDYVGRRMLTSTHPTLRRFWWVPQVAGAGLSFGSAVHNYSLVQ
jgi:hypothetical protein